MKLPLVLPLLALAVGPALAQKIDIEFDESAVFERYKTFHIVRGPDQRQGCRAQ